MAKEELLKELGSTEHTAWQASPGQAHSRLGGNLHSACYHGRQRG